MDRMVLLMVVVVVLFGMLRIIRCGKEGLKNLQCCLLSCFAAAFEHSCKKSNSSSVLFCNVRPRFASIAVVAVSPAVLQEYSNHGIVLEVYVEYVCMYVCMLKYIYMYVTICICMYLSSCLLVTCSYENSLKSSTKSLYPYTSYKPRSWGEKHVKIDDRRWIKRKLKSCALLWKFYRCYI